MKRVADYAIIGDLQSAALVNRNGSIEWFCAPRFDSSAMFSALLGDDGNGFWRLSPTDPSATSERRYTPETLVLETDFTTEAGTVRIIDFMPTGTSLRTIVRVVEGLSGRVECTSTVAPKMKYGLLTPLAQTESGGWAARAAPDAVSVHASVGHAHTEEGLRATFFVGAGESVWFTLQAFDAHTAAPTAIDADGLRTRTLAWWKAWTAGLTYAGDWRDTVVRSAITLKALSYDPAGSFVAAATTSLPERIGDSKNWDYRYCWLRDASFTTRALLQLGFTEEARRWRDWFATVYVDAPEHLHIMYAVDGERLPQERKLDWLSGFEGSVPVKISNGANDQFQLGVFGHVLLAFEQAQRAGVAFDAAHWRMIESLMRHVEHVWQTPGERDLGNT